MKKNNKYGAFIILVALVICWIVICKPFGGDQGTVYENTDSNFVITEIDNSDIQSETEVTNSADDGKSDISQNEVKPADAEQNEVHLVDNEQNDTVSDPKPSEAQQNVQEENDSLILPDESQEVEEPAQTQAVSYRFRNKKLLNQHYEKHGIEMGFASAADYETAASAVINNPNALNKIEAEDGDYVYYVESTNEFVILSTDGYIRTYFNPNSGIAYYNRQ